MVERPIDLPATQSFNRAARPSSRRVTATCRTQGRIQSFNGGATRSARSASSSSQKGQAYGEVDAAPGDPSTKPRSSAESSDTESRRHRPTFFNGTAMPSSRGVGSFSLAYMSALSFNGAAMQSPRRGLSPATSIRRSPRSFNGAAKHGRGDVRQQRVTNVL